MRIVQEAVVNCIKHSRATALTFSASVTEEKPGQIIIEVRDNGQGFDSGTDCSKRGRGLRNMRYRAQQLGAALNVKNNTEGTVVQLALATANI
ncbi:hypothetical protein MHBO_005134 [Bonamia ostreae]|uniref:Histidine kinase/HSP90-like ATPase domain-containing protein n=1 Tax=Bonamia ostreae TaxID=126728 RepID=A0ABV2AV64_9EUKA